MAEHGFTPGPWHVIGAEKRKGGRKVPTVIATGEELKFIAYCDDQLFFYQPTDNAANARLIAASPTLLEALIQAAEEIEDLRKYANNHGGMIDNERCDYARAAITLATGKDA